jgi:hypothetical protein
LLHQQAENYGDLSIDMIASKKGLRLAAIYEQIQDTGLLLLSEIISNQAEGGS